MAWVLLTVTGALAVLVGVLALRVRRLDAQVTRLLASSDAPASSRTRSDDAHTSLDAEPPATEWVITQVGEPVVEVEPEPAATVPGLSLIHI